MSNKAQKLKDTITKHLTYAGRRRSGYSWSFAYGYIIGMSDTLAVDDDISVKETKELYSYMYDDILPLYED